MAHSRPFLFTQKKENKTLADRSRNPDPVFKLGDFVSVARRRVHVGKTRKFACRSVGFLVGTQDSGNKKAAELRGIKVGHHHGFSSSSLSSSLMGYANLDERIIRKEITVAHERQCNSYILKNGIGAHWSTAVDANTAITDSLTIITCSSSEGENTEEDYDSEIEFASRRTVKNVLIMDQNCRHRILHQFCLLQQRILFFSRPLLHIMNVSELENSL